MQNNEHEQPSDISRMLVATLLGEASPEEAAKVERALAASPELRAERDRLQATIGLVQGLDDGAAREHLSPAAAARLAAAADAHAASGAVGGSVLPFQRTERASFGSWTRSPTMRLAASFALLIGALAAWKLGTGGPMAPAGQSVSTAMAPHRDAQYEQEPEANAAGSNALAHDSLAKSGAVPGAGTSSGERPAGGPVPPSLEVAGGRASTLDANTRGGAPVRSDSWQDQESAAGVLQDGPVMAGASVSAVEPRTEPRPADEESLALGSSFEDALGDWTYEAKDLKVEAAAADMVSLARQKSAQAPGESPQVELLSVQADAGPASPGAGSPVSRFSSPTRQGTQGGAGGASAPTRKNSFEGRAGSRSVRRARPAQDTQAQGEVGRVFEVGGEVEREALASLKELGYAGVDFDVDPYATPDFRFEPEQESQLGQELRGRLSGLGYLADDDGGEGGELAEIERRIARLQEVQQRLEPSSEPFVNSVNQLEQLEELRRLVEGDRFEGGRKARAGLEAFDRSRRVEALLRSCRRRPSESPRDMFYRWWGDNAFELTRHDALSTFSVDVDTASYTLARRYLVDGKLPEKAQIRTEEFVNYFKGDVPAPTESTFAVAAELAPSRFNASPDTWMMRVAVRGKEVAKQERMPLALTFVVDISGSMKEERRLELVKHALRLLVGELDARDSIAIVAFTNDARLILPLTSARHRGLIESAIHPLQPEGGTNLEAGLRMGYEVALTGRSREAFNRVVLLSDGVGNIGETDAQRLTDAVAHARDRGVLLNTIGVGMDNHNDALLEQLADKGDGLCNYVDDEREARRALVENFTGAFQPIARDVKIQVEFDPAQVVRYRLLGYENRAIADADFRNDAVDAGEVGAGHQVVALYELERTGGGDPAGPLATVRVRWLPPFGSMTSNQIIPEDHASPARELEHPVHALQAAGAFAQASPGYRRSVLVAQLAEFLRRSIHARSDSFSELLEESRKLRVELAEPEFDEFVQMVERTVALISTEWGRYDDLARRLDALRMQRYLKAQLEDLGRELDRARLEQIERDCRVLEDEVRELLGQRTGLGRLRSIGYTDDGDDDR